MRTEEQVRKALAATDDQLKQLRARNLHAKSWDTLQSIAMKTEKCNAQRNALLWILNEAVPDENIIALSQEAHIP